jgi:hypothetical protein
MGRRASRSSAASRPAASSIGHKVLVISAAGSKGASATVTPPAKDASSSSASTEKSSALALDDDDDDDRPIGISLADIGNIPIAALTLNTPLRRFNPKKIQKPKPFVFLTLPSELRLKIYQYYFADADNVLDLNPDNYRRMHKRLGIIRVCRQLHDEVTHYFYSTRTVRIFPTFPGRYFKTKKPMLARMKPNQRGCLQTLELRLGPGWNAPPRGWVVNDALGLADCTEVHTLRVFVECDPSDGFFNGFRRSDGFYERFSHDLLSDVLRVLPAVRTVEFDAWTSVRKSGYMMRCLLEAATESKIQVTWGPERGWTDDPDENDSLPRGATEMRFVDGAVVMFDRASQNMLTVVS